MKQEAINYYLLTNDVKKTASKFNCSESTVRRWIKKNCQAGYCQIRHKILNKYDLNKDGFISPLAHVSADDIGKIASSRALLMAKIRSEVLPILTPEQQAYARQALAEVRNTIDRDTENIN